MKVKISPEPKISLGWDNDLYRTKAPRPTRVTNGTGLIRAKVHTTLDLRWIART